MEQYNTLNKDQVSVINLPFNLEIVELEKTINNQLKDVIYEDMDSDNENQLKIRAVKKEDISFSLDSQYVCYKVPLDIWIEKDIGFTDVEGQWELALYFKTGFSILEDWNIKTETKLDHYEWYKKPKLKLGAIQVPVKNIANRVIKKSKETLTFQIDKQIQKSFTLRKFIDEAWKQLQEPILIAEEYNTWLAINPFHISMTPLTTSADSIVSNITIKSKPAVTLGEKPSVMVYIPLPAYKEPESFENNFQLHLKTDIPFEEAERIARTELIGESFKQGKYEVKIENIELYGQKNNLIVNAALSGSYNGSIYLLGEPAYDPIRNKLDVEDLKFSLETQNFLMKSAGWLFKSNLKKRIQENLNFLLTDNLNELKTQIQQQLNNYQLAPNVLLQGNLKELQLQNAFLTPFSIRVDITLSGHLNIKVSGVY
ncbi:MAG: DUF4403 family protein [Bacteroidetes bacterium]|nr:DUF4403 family protein [Bacteroidota bacterium]